MKKGYSKDIRELKLYAKKRIGEILPFLHRISLGDFSQKLELPDKQDEFSDLIAAIDLMSSNLEELINENERKTKQINAKNKELKESQKEILLKNALLQSQYDASQEGIVSFDRDMNIISYNESFKKIWKLPKRILEGEKNTEKLMHFFLNQVKEPKKILKKADYMQKHEKTIIKDKIELKDGRVIDRQTAPLTEKSGKYLGRVFYFRDITKEVEIDRAKSEFVSLASHQLQTPLTAIKWLLEILRERVNGEVQELVQEAYRSNERMIQLVNDFLNVSRLEMGTVTIESSPVDLNVFVQSSIHEVSFLAKEKKISIKLVKPKTNIFVELDQNLIEEVLINLLTNAIRYSDPRTTVTVTIRKKPKNVSIAVKDEGIGISKEDQKHIFTKFFRSDRAAEHMPSGSGLGLYIIKKILDVCKGSLHLKSDEGKGATFTVTLPIKGPVIKSTKTIVKQSFNL
jgi:PAS domain S-box-containing protein